MEILTKSAAETQVLGKKLGASLKGGDIVALIGDLGSGKTTFVQGIAQSLDIKNQIISPTFILMRTYNTKKLVDSTPVSLLHVDLYRLEGDINQEITNMGLNDLWGEKTNIVIIEWAEKIKDKLPRTTKYVYFDNLGEDTRKIIIKHE